MSQSEAKLPNLPKQNSQKTQNKSTEQQENLQTHPVSEEKPIEERQAKETKTSNQFVYYVPHEPEEPPKTNNIDQPQKHQSPGSDKSQSRSRSRDKKNHNKQSKNEHDSYFINSEKYERNPRDEQRSYRNHQGDKFKRESIHKDDAYKKTKMCPQFERGQCRKGQDCNFAHSDYQLRGLPDFKKTKLCIAFKQGKCGKLSSQCKYAHGQAQLKKVPRRSADSQDKQGRYTDNKRNKYNNNYPPNYPQNQPQRYNYPIPPPGYMPYPPMYGSNFMCTLDPYMPNVPPPTSNPNEYIQPQRPLNPYPNSSGNTGNNRAYGEYGHQPGFEYNSGNYQPLPYGYYPPPYPSTLPPPPSPYGYQQPKPPI